MELNQIINEIDNSKDFLNSKFHVEKIGIFGSFLDNSQSEKSDIDILVQFNKGYKSFFNYMRFKFYLEDLLKKEIDLVMLDAIKPRLKEKILSQVQYV